VFFLFLFCYFLFSYLPPPVETDSGPGSPVARFISLFTDKIMAYFNAHGPNRTPPDDLHSSSKV
jgi:hypothetical protein